MKKQILELVELIGIIDFFNNIKNINYFDIEFKNNNIIWKIIPGLENEL